MMRTPITLIQIIGFLFCISFLLASKSEASEKDNTKPKLYIYLLKDRLNAKGTLPYNKFLDYALQDVRGFFEVFPAPIKRSSTAFRKSNKACVFPTSIETQRLLYKDKYDTDVLVETAPVDFVSVRLYTKSDQPVIRSQKELKGKVVGHLLGSAGEAMLTEKDLVLRRVPDEGRLVRLLFSERIDVLLGHHPDTPMALDRLGLGQVSYDPSLTLYKTSVTIVCHPFPGIKKVLEKINLRIREMRNSAMAREILGPHAEIVPLSEEEIRLMN